MKGPIVLGLLALAMWAQEPPKEISKDPMAGIRADLAIAQRDYERLHSQCEIQAQSSDQARWLVTLLKTATEACKAAGDQMLNPDRLVCVPKGKPEAK